MVSLVCTSTITKTLMVRMIDDSSRDWGKARETSEGKGYRIARFEKGSVRCAGVCIVLLISSVYKFVPFIFYSSYWLALLARGRRDTRTWPLSTEAIFIPPGEGWGTTIQTPFIRRRKMRKKKKKWRREEGEDRKRGRNNNERKKRRKRNKKERQLTRKGKRTEKNYQKLLVHLRLTERGRGKV